MIDTAWAYAAKNNLLRVSPIHGEEEAKLILGENFSFTKETGASSSREITMEVEETWAKP